MSVELKNCPFCGGNDISEGEALSRGYTKQAGCRECGALGSKRVEGRLYDNTESNKAWNIRASDRITAEKDALLKEILNDCVNARYLISEKDFIGSFKLIQKIELKIQER